VLEREEASEKAFLGSGNQAHIHRCLRATQDRAQGDHQNLQQLMPSSIARPRILKTFKAARKPLHPNRQPVESICGHIASLSKSVKSIPNAIPLRRPALKVELLYPILNRI
jgi:hypothetical protein